MTAPGANDPRRTCGEPRVMGEGGKSQTCRGGDALRVGSDASLKLQFHGSNVTPGPVAAVSRAGRRPRLDGDMAGGRGRDGDGLLPPAPNPWMTAVSGRIAPLCFGPRSARGRQRPRRPLPRGPRAALSVSAGLRTRGSSSSREAGPYPRSTGRDMPGTFLAVPCCLLLVASTPRDHRTLMSPSKRPFSRGLSALYSSPKKSFLVLPNRLPFAV